MIGHALWMAWMLLLITIGLWALGRLIVTLEQHYDDWQARRAQSITQQQRAQAYVSAMRERVQQRRRDEEDGSV